MERFTIEVRDEQAAQALRESAAANGHTVEEELAAVVERELGGRRANPRALVDELIAIVGDDAEIYLPPREAMNREPVFFHDDFS